MRRFLQRLGIVMAVAGAAVLCLSSSYLAAAIGIVTAAAVGIDTIVFARMPHARSPSRDDTPDHINVDLSRRQ